MNRDELETRLRSPRRLEREYTRYRDRPRPSPGRAETFGPRVSLAAIPLLLVIIAVLVGVRGGVFSGIGAGPQSSAPLTGPEPSKPWVSVTATATPPLSLAACAPEKLSVRLEGWGAAGGTTYAAIRLSLVGAVACRLPAVPAVSILDSTGSVLASRDRPIGSAVALNPTLIARVGLSSLCGPSPARPIVVSLDFGSGIKVSVPLPSDFGAQCNGGGNQVAVDELFAP